jgi:hypothetical protein
VSAALHAAAMNVMDAMEQEALASRGKDRALAKELGRVPPPPKFNPKYNVKPAQQSGPPADYTLHPVEHDPYQIEGAHIEGSSGADDWNRRIERQLKLGEARRLHSIAWGEIAQNQAAPIPQTKEELEQFDLATRLKGMKPDEAIKWLGGLNGRK